MGVGRKVIAGRSGGGSAEKSAKGEKQSCLFLIPHLFFESCLCVDTVLGVWMDPTDQPCPCAAHMPVGLLEETYFLALEIRSLGFPGFSCVFQVLKWGH